METSFFNRTHTLRSLFRDLHSEGSAALSDEPFPDDDETPLLGESEMLEAHDLLERTLQELNSSRWESLAAERRHLELDTAAPGTTDLGEEGVSEVLENGMQTQMPQERA